MGALIVDEDDRERVREWIHDRLDILRMSITPSLSDRDRMRIQGKTDVLLEQLTALCGERK